MPIAGGSTLTEGQHAGEFLLGEASVSKSRETITVLSGQNLAAGAVVGRVKYGIGGVSLPTVVGTGTGTVMAQTVAEVFGLRAEEITVRMPAFSMHASTTSLLAV